MGKAPCCDKTKVRRGPWSPEEDILLINFAQKHGTGGNWMTLPQKAGVFAFSFVFLSLELVYPVAIVQKNGLISIYIYIYIDSFFSFLVCFILFVYALLFVLLLLSINFMI